MFYFFVTLTFSKVKTIPGLPRRAIQCLQVPNPSKRYPARSGRGRRKGNEPRSIHTGGLANKEVDIRCRYAPEARPSNQLRPKSPGFVTLVSRCARKFTEKVDGGAGKMVEYSHAHQTQMYIKLNLPEPVHIYRRTGVCFFGPTRSLDSGRAIFFSCLPGSYLTFKLFL